MLGFHDPLEAALGRLDWAGAGIDLAARRKSHLIEADLGDARPSARRHRPSAALR